MVKCMARPCALVAWVFATFFAVNCFAGFKVEGSVARFDGAITLNEVQEFLKSERLGEVKKLEIRSKGGDVIAAIQLANWIAENAIDVEVLEVCASSCANYIFPAGRTKTIREGAILIWHGGAFQRSFVNFGRLYEKALLRVKLNEGSAADQREVSEGAERYTSLMLNQSLEREFFKRIAVNHQLPTIGQQSTGNSVLWTLSLDQMKTLGLKNVIAPTDYASEAYIRDWQAANFKMQGDSRASIRRITLHEQISSCE